MICLHGSRDSQVIIEVLLCGRLLAQIVKITKLLICYRTTLKQCLISLVKHLVQVVKTATVNSSSSKVKAPPIPATKVVAFQFTTSMTSLPGLKFKLL